MASTSTIGAGAAEGTTVTYEQLHEIQEQFEDAEVELVRQHVQITKPILEKRARAIAGIPNFWPLVFEQAPQDIDEYIQPTDANVLMSSLKSISVSHFEIEEEVEGGDPRSISIKWEFGDNEYFEDKVLEKKFWYRRSRGSDWSGLVSEPVDINWKPGKDLTRGLLASVRQVWSEEMQEQDTATKVGKPKELTPSQKALKKKIESAGGVGGVSFFAWFGYRGRNITAEENRKAQEERRVKLQGNATEETNEDEDVDDQDDQDDLEAFPGGDELAVCIADDLWQDAIKYFMQAQEDDGDDSGDDFESDEEDDVPMQTPEQPAAKKQKK